MALFSALLLLLTPLSAEPFPPPSNCPIPTWNVTSLSWFQGSHSLDCVDRSNIPKACLGCGGWCNPDPVICNASGGGLIDPCLTGLRDYEPWGYGPTETLDIIFADGLSCHDQYMGYRVMDPGNGVTNCGYGDRAAGRWISFYGTTKEDVSTARIDYTLGGGYHRLTCEDGKKITYSGSKEFELRCSYDAQRNATCTAQNVVIVPNEWHYQDN